ncbi:Sugar phosphate permease [Actinacidiphila yanglinensis]|uniref:Sugar phosphate permease n=1 Tax=Actinacidiphila yanglinensis TaxID=310779 RepID=A0A1H5SPI7_9ACTN|nr:MFS transporter [Actinacidiphila yanglinensis]SEF52354.1 Sugar phosphate permease [Actinacidiphila yanglinensis]
MPSANYRALLRTTGAAAFFLPASCGRVGVAMTSLSIVWLVHAHTGTFASAGLVSGGCAVAEAVGAPQVARLVDRFGQSRVLPPALLAHALAMAALVVLVTAGAPDALLAAGGVLVGVSVPQLGAMSAARWAALLRGDRAGELPTAFALESVSNSVGYLVGPALVSTLAAAGHPAAGTVLAASLSVSGGLLLAAQRGSAPATAPPTGGAAHERGDRSLLRGGVAVLMGLNLAIGVFFGAMQVSVTAFAVEHGAPGAAAVILAVSSCSELLAGWLYGLRRWRAALQVQLFAATCALLLGTLLMLTVGSPLGLGLVVVLTGAAVPRLLVLFSVLTEATVHRDVLTQAFSWLGSASAAGSATAAGVSGWAIDALGSRGGFTVAAAAAAVMALQGLAGLRVLRLPQGRAARVGPG